VVSFTGSAETAAVIRSHPAVAQRSVRVNIEADSINSALLLPGEAAGSAALDLLAKEVAREMTVKSGQKCTAIRRVFVPEALVRAAAPRPSPRAWPRPPWATRATRAVRMGALVNRAQFNTVREGLAQLRRRPNCCTTARRTRWWTPTRPWPAASAPRCWACARPHKAMRRPRARHRSLRPRGHVVPTATPHALALVRRGQGSLVALALRQRPRRRWPPRRWSWPAATAVCT
jgi:3,4-dehydroadipyl-CoA semialdehyde dehydrogenase